MKNKIIEIAHSPDADDIFMYYAIKFGWVDTQKTIFKNIGLDIETLNLDAINGKFDISAISFGVYPKIKNDYALLNSGVSFGEGYGPKLIKRKGEKLKRNFKVALSGENTTNGLLFKIAYPQARIKYMNFLEIENAILEKSVDAGVLIHESILNFSQDLEIEKEIWDIWLELNNGKELPLPLGGMVIRRSFPLNLAIDYQNIIIHGVELAIQNKKILSKMLIERNLIRVDEVALEKYLSLYANDNSIKLSKIQIEALNQLYKIGWENGLFESPINIENYMIPEDYNKFRLQ